MFGTCAITCPFLSTLPARGATRPLARTVLKFLKISIHAPREGSDARFIVYTADVMISIHAPREGSDRPLQRLHGSIQTISIHAPREGSDSGARAFALDRYYFYPRSPRGERPFMRLKYSWMVVDFYPRSPRGERRRS